MFNQQKPVILSGMRPTGRLHLGNYVGALRPWVRMQDDFTTYFFSADYHALTTNPDSRQVEQNSFEMIVDWLSAGLDPERSLFFRQSQVKQHTELHLIFSMLIGVGRLERNPSLKEQVRDLREMVQTGESDDRETTGVSYGHLGYPVLQAADILLYGGQVVPVGEDQLPHVEITRELARRFNETYGSPVFPVPEPKLSETPRLVGTDGRAKMSKSLGNVILLSDDAKTVEKQIKKLPPFAGDDPTSLEVIGNPLFDYLKAFAPDADEVAGFEAAFKAGEKVNGAIKAAIARHINTLLEPMRERRAGFEAHPDTVRDILRSGESKARGVAEATMIRVRDAMGMGQVGG